MITLTEFLLARIAEDKAVALGAANIPPGVEQTASVPQRSDARWRGYNPDGSEMLMHAPVSDAPDAHLDPIGRWGWSGGPVSTADNDPELVRIFELRDDLDAPYRISDSGLWDEFEPVGAAYFRATIPSSAGESTARHIARHDPARVLAECAVKRSVLDLLIADSGDSHNAVRRGWAVEISHQYAAIYADHPDFDPAWRV